MIKTLQKVGIDSTYLNIIKAIYDKPTARIILNGKKLKAFPLRSGTREESTLTIFIQYSFGIPSYSNQRTNWSKVNPNWKRKKLNCHCSQMTWYYTYKILDASRKLVELINESGKVESYKINTHKSVAFLYINNKRSEREIPRSNSIYHCIKKKKISRNKPTQWDKRPVLQRL